MPYSRLILLYIVSYLVTSLAQAQTTDHAEYFFDRDPGLGQAIPITVSSPGGDITLTFAAGLSDLDPGYHVLYVRSHDISGPWSLNYAHPFYIPDNTAPQAPVDVAYLEYFIDRDPGQGQAVPVNITPSNDITTNFTVPLTDIPTGFHTLYLRSRDQNGQWSILAANPFYIPDTSSLPDPADLAFLEYYIDQDPGLTQAEAVGITQGQDIAVNFAVSLSDIPSGFHTLYVRSRNRYGHWTVNFAHPFYLADTSSLPDPAKIVKMEYFIDNDPGLGNGEAVAITPQTDITVNFAISLQPVEPGFHTLYTRSQDLKGKWTLTAAHPFFINASPLPDPPDIGSIEYLFAAGEFKSSTRYFTAFTPGKDVNISFAADLSGLVLDSTYTMRLSGRDRSGVRSLDVFSNDSLIQPVLRLSQLSVSFDSVVVGDSSMTTVHLLANKDSATIENFIFNDGMNFRITSSVDLPFLLFPDDSIALEIWYKPVTVGEHIDNITVISNAPDAPLVLNLFGTGYLVDKILSPLPSGIPTELTLYANFPNPFNPVTTIRFGLPAGSNVRLAVYDILGAKVKQITDKKFNAGYHQLTWDGRSQNGKIVSSGVYIYRLDTSDGTVSRRMLVIR